MDPFAQLQDALGASYRLERELGGGGMSRVYLAHERALDRSVVIKVLAPDLAGNLSADRFQREITLAARLQHPQIVPLLAAGHADGTSWYAMPYVEGETLRTRLSHGELPIAEAVHILRDIAGALAYAHEHGVVHRDIKPENVLLTDGRAVVTDFGVAKALIDADSTAAGALTSVGIALGTPAYMAPEQSLGDPRLDHRVDLYALGVIAHEMLSGFHPFGQRSLQALIAAHAAESPPSLSTLRPAVPDALAALVAQCLAKSPADRPQDARAIVRVLDTLAFTPTAAGALPPRAGSPSWRHARVLVPSVALLLIAVAALWSRSGRTQDDLASSRRIAVLPFVNLTGDTAFSHLGELASYWVTQGIIAVDARRAVQDVAVKAILASAGAGEDAVGLVARRTGASLIVHGSISRAGDSVLVDASLSDGISGTPLRVLGPFTASVSNPRPAIDELQKRIVGALEYSALQARSLDRLAMPRSDAFSVFQEGIEHYVEFRNEQAAEAFRRAVSLDTTFITGYLYLGSALRTSGRNEELAPIIATLMKRRAALSASDRLRVDLMDALFRNESDRGDHILQQLVDADSLVGEIQQLGLRLLRTLRTRESIRAFTHAYDVLTANGWAFPSRMLATAYHLDGNFDAELALIVRARQLFPFVHELVLDQLHAYAGLGAAEPGLALADSVLSWPQHRIDAHLAVARAGAEFLAHGDSATATLLTRRFLESARRLGPAVPEELSGQFIVALLLVNDVGEARRRLPDFLRGTPNVDRRALAAFVAARSGDTTSARAVADSLAALDENGRAVYLAGAVHAHLGNNELALRYLRQSLPLGLNLGATHFTHHYRPLRGNPEFEAIIAPKR